MSTTPNFSQATAIFGGSFDPPHLGHLHVARTVLQNLPFVTNVCFVPASVSPGKPAPKAAGAQRAHWLRQILTAKQFSVWDYEVNKGGTSYTVETIIEAHRLGASKSNLYLVLGEDSYLNFSQWRNPEKIRAHCQLVVVARTGTNLKAQDQADRLLSPTPHPASSRQIRAELEKNDFSSAHLPEVVRKDLETLALQGKNIYSI